MPRLKGAVSADNIGWLGTREVPEAQAHVQGTPTP